MRLRVRKKILENNKLQIQLNGMEKKMGEVQKKYHDEIRDLETQLAALEAENHECVEQAKKAKAELQEIQDKY